jgi:uncharacterized membrane protein
VPEAEHRNESVTTVASLRARAERGIGRHQRWVESFTATIARPASLYVFVLSIATWVTYNGAVRSWGGEPFDPPPFSLLQGLVGAASLLVATTVLVTQSRQSRDFEHRAELELQVNLLAEQKVAKLIALVEELRRDIPSVENRVDEVAEMMTQPVDPHAVLSALEETFEAPRPGPTHAPSGPPPEKLPGERGRS